MFFVFIILDLVSQYYIFSAVNVCVCDVVYRALWTWHIRAHFTRLSHNRPSNCRIFDTHNNICIYTAVSSLQKPKILYIKHVVH